VASEAAAPPNNRLKLTAVRWRAAARPQLKRVFGGPAVGNTQGLPGNLTTEGLPPPSEGIPWLHWPRSRRAACARKQQFIGKNRQLMTFSGNSATKGIPSRAWR